MQDDSRRGWHNLLLLCLLSTLGSFDGGLLYLLLEPIKRDLTLSDAQLAIITGSAVGVISAVAAFPIGLLADRFGRRRLLAGSVLFWALMTALCGFADSFGQLLAASVGLALGEAGRYPILCAMVPELVTARQRPLANAILLCAIVTSGAIGLMIGAKLFALIEATRPGGIAPWRATLMAASLLGPLFAATLAGIRPLTQPLQGVVPSEPTRPLGAAGLSRFLRAHGPLIAGLFTALSLYSTAWGLWLVWTPALLARLFGYAPATAGMLAGRANLGGSVVALVGAQLAVRWLQPSLGHRFTIRTLSVSCALALLPVLLFPAIRSAWVFLSAFAAEIACITLAATIGSALLQDIAPAVHRSSVMGLLPLIGLPVKLAGPAAVGLISDRVANQGLLTGVCIVSGLCLASAMLIFALTEARYARLADSLAQTGSGSS